MGEDQGFTLGPVMWEGRGFRVDSGGHTVHLLHTDGARRRRHLSRKIEQDVDGVVSECGEETRCPVVVSARGEFRIVSGLQVQ